MRHVRRSVGTRTVSALVAAAVVAACLQGCAAKTPRDKARVASLTVAKAIFALDDAEKTIAAAKLPFYTEEISKTVSGHIRQLLLAGNAFNTAVLAWPADGTLTNLDVEDALNKVRGVLRDLTAAIPMGATSLRATLATVSAVLESWRTSRFDPADTERYLAALARRGDAVAVNAGGAR